MSYATYSDFNTRYATRMSEAEINSHYLPYASARLESLLGGAFTVPFSSNNLTARDLTMELGYLMVLRRGKGPQDYQAFADTLAAQLGDLRDGRQPMITTSGEALFAQPIGEDIWSSTARYHTVFDLRDAPRQQVDPQNLLDSEQA